MRTVSYNDISEYDVLTTRNFPAMLEIFRTFVKNGGDLSLDLKVSEQEITDFHSWMVKRYEQHPEYFVQMVQENLIKNPFKFNIDESKKTVRDQEKYGRNWLRQNMDKYPNEIALSVHTLAKEISHWDLQLEDYVFGRTMSIQERRNMKNDTTIVKPRYQYRDYHNEENIDNVKHPLIHIAEFFNNYQIYEAILSASPEYSKLFSYDTDNLQQLFEQRPINNKIYRVFYKYNIGRDIIDNNHNYLKDMIIHSISDNDIQFVQDNISHWDIPSITELLHLDSLYKFVQSDEMGKILHDNKIPLLHINNKEKELSILRDIKFPALRSIMNNFPHISEQIATSPKILSDIIFNFNVADKMEAVKYLVQHNSKIISNLDSVHISMLTDIENMSWFIENGSDPRNCEKAMSKAVRDREEGLKTLKQMQKQGVFNCFYPDPIYHMMKAEPTKTFTTWLDKAPKEQYNRLTKEGMPAWWGFSNEYTLNLIKNKVEDFNQLSSDGLSYIHNLLKKNNSIYKSIYKEILPIADKTTYFSLSGQDSDGNNALHLLFNSIGNNSSNHILAMILKSPESFGQLLIAKNNNNLTPFSILLKSAERHHVNIKDFLKEIITRAMTEIDLDTPVLTEKDIQSTMYEVMKELLIGDDTTINTLDKVYQSVKLHEKLSSTIETKEERKTKHKI